MGRPASGLDEYLDWQERLESYKASGLSVDEFCLSEGIGKSTYYRWLDRLKNGLPEEMVEEAAARNRIESGGAVFVPISLKASPVEIELPNGGDLNIVLAHYNQHTDVGAAVPEPSTVVLFSVGAISLLASAWRRRRHGA